jgi:PIN domain nuclease of toxin-antitoxin system
MKLLLDTHAVLWWLADADLDPQALDAIADPGNLVFVSAASVWEAAIKAGLGKLDIPEPLDVAFRDDGFEPMPIAFAHAERAGGLPVHHRDPFDRMLIAQAQIEGLTIVTRDPAFAPYDVTVLAC